MDIVTLDKVKVIVEKRIFQQKLFIEYCESKFDDKKYQDENMIDDEDLNEDIEDSSTRISELNYILNEIEKLKK